MKRAHWWLVTVGLSLAGCSNKLQIESGSDAERYCQQRAMFRQGYSTSGTCFTPPELGDYLVATEPQPGLVKLTFRKLLDGSLPKLVEVEYRNFDESTKLGVPFALECGAAAASADGEQRSYECKIPEAAKQPWGKYVMGSLQVEHEHCGTSASYKGIYLNQECDMENNPYSYFLSRVDTYAGSVRVPDIERD